MSLRDILNDAYDLVGVAISDKKFIMDYNRALHDLAMIYDTAKSRDTIVINCTDTKAEYSLDSGCLKIERVLDANSDYFKYFTVRGNSKILFQFTGAFTVYEMFEQPKITSMSDTVTIDTAYLKAVAEYIAAKAIKEKSPERSKELMSDYSNDAALANLNIRKVVNPNKRVAVRPFR